MPKVEMTTLGYIEKNDAYLMLHRVKKKNDVNQDKWIGIGGKFEYGESPEECLKREALEETGLTVTSFRFRGILTFICDLQEPEYICLYTIDGFEGEIGECNEGTLEWIPKAEISNLNLWEGDRIFFRLFDENAPFFSLKLHYEKDKLTEAVLNGEKLYL
nr:8-oxo-dGTP diphosphatase [uncultured Sellimonas sp.]